VEAFALDGEGSLAILLRVEFCPLQYISLPLAHDRVVVKVHVAWQAALGAVDDAQEGAAVCRLRVELEGFLHAQAECRLYLQLHGGNGAFAAKLGQYLVQVYLVFIPCLALGGDVLAANGCGDALPVEPGLQVLALGDGAVFPDEGEEAAQDADLVLDSGGRLAARAPVLYEFGCVAFTDFANFLYAG